MKEEEANKRVERDNAALKNVDKIIETAEEQYGQKFVQDAESNRIIGRNCSIYESVREAEERQNDIYLSGLSDEQIIQDKIGTAMIAYWELGMVIKSESSAEMMKVIVDNLNESKNYDDFVLKAKKFLQRGDIDDGSRTFLQHCIDTH